VIAVQQQGHAVTFSVKVHPRARHDRITGTLANALKLEITAPPVDGKANEACIRFFAELLKVPRSSVTIAAGNSSRNKVIRVAGISSARVGQALAATLNH
jgi:uncharacterized protein